MPIPPCLVSIVREELMHWCPSRLDKRRMDEGTEDSGNVMHQLYFVPYINELADGVEYIY